MNGHEVKTLTVPSDPDDPSILERVDAFTVDITKDLPFTDDERDNIAISVSEAVNNAIIHGNDGNPSLQITIDFKIEQECLHISVTDQGDGFNPAEVPDPTDPENLLAESGRGLLIIRHLMDEVELTNGENGGTRVVMSKAFKPSRV
ncbi:ATP-binding protein [bacterium]|nr:ATP-binding protein [bacterium]